VGQGSTAPPRLVELRYAPEGVARPVAGVGKGITFDTGGLSLKPSEAMMTMKMDMAGAATALAVVKAAAELGLPVAVTAVLALAENMPSGSATRVSDVLTAKNGTTIEVTNTDAEGRLVLCDVLWYAQEHFKPTAIVDLATLTGAIVISLGHEHAGLFCNDDKLAAALDTAGKAEGETVWRMPLGENYDRLLKSQFADMKNIGGRSAGSITAAQFLQRFINEGQAWAHIDIAGVAWKEGEKSPLEPGWASGFGPRLLDRWIRDNHEG